MFVKSVDVSLKNIADAIVIAHEVGAVDAVSQAATVPLDQDLNELLITVAITAEEESIVDLAISKIGEL